MAMTAGSPAGAGVHDVVQRFFELKRQYVPGARIPPRTDRAQRHAAKYLEWCVANDVQPLPFMEARFTYCAKKGQRVGLKSMGSRLSLKHWREYECGRFTQTKYFASAKPVERTVDEKRVLTLMREPTLAQESLRRSHQMEGRTSVCMLDAKLIGGYDPRSQLCPRCPDKHACLIALNSEHGFDVGALRVRLFARLPAEIANVARKLLLVRG